MFSGSIRLLTRFSSVKNNLTINNKLNEIFIQETDEEG